MSDKPEFGKQYRLLWRKPGEKRVGEVRNSTVDGEGFRIVPIWLDDTLMTRIKMRFLVTNWGNRGPQIFVNSDFMALPVLFRETGIWHEVGHIHHKHFLHDDFLNQTQLRSARSLAVKTGRVMPQEKEADHFAVARVGQEAVIGFLEYLLATRPTGGALGWNDIGRRELELRIAAIQSL
jgi:hypothetical protein